MKITLPRSGDRPLQFEGSELTEASSDLLTGKRGSRWHELALYGTNSGFVLSIGYRTQWEGEFDHDFVEVLPDLEAVVGTLQAYDPCDFVRGFPDYPQFRPKQEVLFRDIRSRYDAAVSDLLAELPEVLVDLEEAAP